MRRMRCEESVRRVCVGFVECEEMWSMACVTRVTRVELCGACVEIVLRGRHLINWLKSESVEDMECLH